MVFAFGNQKKTDSVVLIDVGESSVAGAYVRYADNDIPTVIYTHRLPVEAKSDEPREDAVLRALHVLGELLVTEGAPMLARIAGSGHVQTIVASINAPWQNTSVRVERLEHDAPFLITKALVAKALEKSTISAPKKLLVDESIIGTMLNGYRTNDPYGKSAHRADIVILTSLIDEQLARSVSSALQSQYHTGNVHAIASGSLRFQTMQRVFPHENNALIIDSIGPVTSIAIIRNGLLAAVVDVPDADVAQPWSEHIENELAELAKDYPLPRTIFLLTGEPDAQTPQDKLSAAVLEKLWLSDNPPKIVTVTANNLKGMVRQTAPVPPDLPLLLMALYYFYRSSDRTV